MARIERETALAAIEQREKIQREADEKPHLAQVQRDDAALEQHRRNAWVNHRVDEALASGNPDAAMLGLLSRDPATDIPEGIWPPGASPDDFRTLVACEPSPPDEDARKHLPDNRHRLIKIGGLRNRFGDLLAIRLLGGISGRIDNRANRSCCRPPSLAKRLRD